MSFVFDGYGLLVDLQWPVDGRGMIYIDTHAGSELGKPDLTGRAPNLVPLIEWEAPPWDETDRCPVAWTIIPQADGKQAPLLAIIAGPQVFLQPKKSGIAAKGSMRPVSSMLKVEQMIVRTLDNDEVPQVGERIGYADLLRRHYISRDNKQVLAPDKSEKFNWILVNRTPNGVAVTHGLQQWQVIVEASDPNQPSYTDVDVSMDGKGDIEAHVNTRSQVYIVRSQNTVVRGHMPPTKRIPGDPYLRDLVNVRETVMQIHEIPDHRWRVPHGDSPVTALEIRGSPYYEFINFVPMAIYLGLSFVPIVGEAIDIIDLTLINAYGRDLMGDEAGVGTAMLTTASLFAGPFLEGAENASKLRRLRSLGGAGENAGDLAEIPAAVAEEVINQLPPITAKAMGEMDAADQARFADSLVAASKSRNRAAKVSETIEEIVAPLVEKAGKGSDMPAPVLADEMRHVHPAELPAFGQLASEVRHSLIRNYAGAVSKADNLSVAALGRTDPDFWAVYSAELCKSAVTKLVSPLGDTLFHPTLRDGFAKHRKSGGKLDAVGWLLAQRQNSRYFKILKVHLGGNAQNQIRQVFDRLRKTHPPPSPEEIADAVGYLVGLANGGAKAIGQTVDVLQPAEYGVLKRLTSGYGRIFEVDHLLEKRFRHLFHELPFHEDDFWAMIQPKNGAILKAAKDAFAAYGLKEPFLYSHALKTKLMQRYIPKERAFVYTAQEIYLAHYQVLVHELKMPRKMFHASFDPMFHEAAPNGVAAFLQSFRETDPVKLRAQLARAASRTKPVKSFW